VNEHERLWGIVQKHANDGDVEETLTAIAAWLAHDASVTEHETCKALLESAAESCRSASFEFYASTK
jgi:hypothetical protein